MSSLTFHERQTRAIRIWHWLTFIVTALLSFTVMVSKTFLNGMHAGFTIDHTTARLGNPLTVPQVSETVDALRKTIWKWHTRFGFILSALFIFRIGIEIFQHKLYDSFKKGISFFKIKEERKTANHYLIVKFIYLLFYMLLGTMVATGLWMAYYNDTVLVSPERFHDVKETHEACFNSLLLFILVHLAGVIRAEQGMNKNIVSGMIHGNKKG